METFLSLVMTPLMAVEILTAEFIVARFFERKPYFYLRFFGSAALCIFLTVWIELMYFTLTGTQFNYGAPSDTQGIVFKVFYYIAIFGMTIFCVWFSYRRSFIIVLVCCSMGYAIQYLASSLGLLLELCTEGLSPPYLYLAEAAVWLVTRLSVYLSFFFLLRRKRFEEEKYGGNNKYKVILVFLVVFVFICLSRLSNDDPNRSLMARIVEPLYAMLCSAFILVTELSMVRSDAINNELLDMKMLLRQEHEHYLMTKENIEIINEKCHDLKHQIAYLRKDNSDQYISEIEKAVMIYDATVKTGSTVLDILLTEKKLQCESKSIRLTSVVNGKLLEFMDEMDVYSLFGNALSNAIESVGAIPQVDKRNIALIVKQNGGMCSIHVENPYIGELKFSDDLPETTKDKDWHGFGMKSMNRVVTKYRGVMTVTADNGLFRLDILLPVE